MIVGANKQRPQTSNNNDRNYHENFLDLYSVKMEEKRKKIAREKAAKQMSKLTNSLLK